MHKINFSLRILAAVFAVLVISSPAMANEKPEIFAQLGHTHNIRSVAFSPYGRYIVSGSFDKTIRLWNASTGREVRTITGHTDEVSSVAFSPDGRYIASGSWGETVNVKLWETSTGREIRTLAGHTDYVESVAFSPDGRYVASGSRDKTVKLWDATTGREIRTLVGHTDSVKSVAFSPDGRYLVSGSQDKTVRLWEASTGREIRILAGHTGSVESVAFSPDGRYIGSGSHDDTVKLWETSTGRTLRTLLGPKGMGVIESVAFSRDGKYVLSTIWGENVEGGNLKVWEVRTGKELKTFKNVFLDLSAMAISPDGKTVLTGASDSHAFSLRLWDLSTGRELRKMGGDVAVGGNSVAFSPDGRYLLAEAPCGTLRLFDIWDAKEVMTYKEKDSDSGVNLLTFSPDGRYFLAARGWDKAIDVWDVSSGKRISSFSGHKGNVGSIAISPDGRYALSADYFLEMPSDLPKNSMDTYKRSLKLWVVATGKLVRNLEILLSNEVGTHYTRYDLWGAAFSADGKYAVARVTGGGIIVWDVFTGRRIEGETRYAPGFPIFCVPGSFRAYAPDGKYASTAGCISSDGKYELLVFSPWNKRILKLRDIPKDGTISRIYRMGMGPEDKGVATFAGHTNLIRSAVFSPNGKQAVSGSYDGTTRFWDISTGKEIAQFIRFKDGEWIVVTPEGYYNSSANGDKHLNVRIGNNVYGIDQYRSTFYKPRIVEAALRGGDVQNAVAKVIGEQKTVSSIRNIEPPFIVIKSPEDGKKINSTDAEISLYIEDRNQTIKKVKVFVNGRVATGVKGRGIKVTGAIPEGKKSLELKIPVHLDMGENLIEVTAFNGFSEGRKSIRLYSSAASAKGKVILPNLWILSIGINRYQDKKLNSLSYAAADAEGIVKAFSGQKGKLFREINLLVINDRSHIKPTYENIVDNLNYLSRAGNNDVAILFIAGHGMNDDRGEFYFLPSDAFIKDDGTIKRSKAISWREIKSILDIPAKKLIFADTCHSEGVSGKKTRGVDNDRFVKELQEANAVIFTSSRGRELSQESGKWKHGAFTYALIEGIKGKADLIKDNKISMKELDAYVSETVPKITGGAQHPITNTPDGYVNFPVAILK